MKLKRLTAIILMLLLLIGSLAGCKSEQEEGGKEAAAGDYVAGETADDQGNVIIQNQGDGQQPSEDKEETPSKPDGGSDPQDTPPADGENGGNEDEGTVEEPEDPYEVPISKTPAKTDDGVSYYVENKLKVVSYNIRCANDPNGNSIEERAPRLMEVLDQYDPDLIGFQEYVVAWEEPTYFHLSEEYDYVLKYRSASNSEGTPIYYKKSKFKLLDEGHFWLSETPDQESKGWGADYWRICSWVKLEIRQTGKVIFFFNTHFDFKDEPQVNSAKLLIKQATDICKGAPMIVSADYNMTWKSKGYAEMTTFFTDVNLKRDETKTYSGYKDPASSLIDFIFVTGKTIKPTAYKVMNEKPDGKFVSDHYGVYSEIIIL
ncbi:MAG: hypothetical protein IJC46_01590 [Clostridia bacterium]|nr:hypothetical protein [Clostridia bacterium]